MRGVATLTAFAFQFQPPTATLIVKAEKQRMICQSCLSCWTTHLYNEIASNIQGQKKRVVWLRILTEIFQKGSSVFAGWGLVKKIKLL